MRGALAADVTLPGTPNLPALYRQAILLAAKRTVRRTGPPDGLPPPATASRASWRISAP